MGICLSGIMLYGLDVQSLSFVFKSIISVFYDNGINWDSAYIFIFLIILGVITQLILYSGAIDAFVKWAKNIFVLQEVRSFLAFIAGVVIFIDDYFNTLNVGQIARPLNDSYHSSRERLAYNIGLLPKQNINEPFMVLLQKHTK